MEVGRRVESEDRTVSVWSSSVSYLGSVSCCVPGFNINILL